MSGLILKTNKDCDLMFGQYPKTKKYLDILCHITFSNLRGIKDIISQMESEKEYPGKIYVPTEDQVQIDSLPFTIKNLPVYYHRECCVGSLTTIATIKVIDD